MTISKNAILKRVNDFVSTERSSKATLSALSRDLLTYVYESNDSPMINRLIEGLTPANKRVACQFFPQFVAWEWDKETQKFGKKKKAKVVENTKAKVDKELENADFNMWSWYEAKGDKPEKKPTDYKKALTNNLVKGLKGDGDNKLTVADIAAAMFAANVSLRDLMEVAESYANIQKIEQAA